jgi:hypothetical protein
VPVAKDVAADAEYHRPVPFDECPKRRLGQPGVTGDESLQQLTVRQASKRPVLE